jgi:hypothetical protein
MTGTERAFPPKRKVSSPVARGAARKTSGIRLATAL